MDILGVKDLHKHFDIFNSLCVLHILKRYIVHYYQ